MSEALPATRAAVIALHAERSRRRREAVARLELVSHRLSNFRGLSFAVSAAAALAALLVGPESRVACLALSSVALATFVVLVVLHARQARDEEHARRQLAVSERAEQRVGGRWRELDDDGAGLAPAAHPYADDLDLFGPGSVFQRLSTARTRHGRAALAALIGTPTSPEVGRARQIAVRALAPLLDWRQDLEALGVELVQTRGKTPQPPPDAEPLLRWAEQPTELEPAKALRLIAIAVSLSWLVVLAATQLGALPRLAWLLPLTASLLLIARTREATTRSFLAVSATEGAFLRYGRMLEAVERCPAEAPLIAELRARHMSGAAQPSAAMRRFERWLGFFELKHNGLIHPFVNLLTLWDLHCTLGLDAWRREAGPHLRAWFELLGEFEALASLGALAHDEPEFCFPELTDTPGELAAVALGHPLIDAERRVANDLELGGAGRALLITGSNMSGKSTFLRSVGLAVVLGAAGAPVCATSLRLGPVVLRTSLRVRDSLGSGVSHFYAEIEKLKRALDATEGGEPVLFLLDEILHGTNSRERQIGARWILAELLRRGATGIVTTHDMELCALPEPLMQQVTQAHFRETVVDEKMSFDHLLRAGPVQSGNALRLMRLVGLGVPME